MKRPEWSRIGFLAAAIGSAVGLGNIWRFPYIVGENGGGAFLIPYFIAILLFGIPVMLLELSTGRKFRGSIMTALKKINPKLKHFGLIPVFMLTIILSYYVVIMSWTLAYSFFSLFGYMEFTQFTSSFIPIILFLVVIVIITIIVGKGIKKGIEKTCKWGMPLLLFFFLILLVRSFFLPGFAEGMSFYLKPNLSLLSNPRIWMTALGQAFFSLSVGAGIMLTYGSYLSKKINLTKSTYIISISDTLIAVLSGIIIFPIVFSFNFNPAAGPELAFITLPKIFTTMPFGHILGFFFFSVLFIGALTSAISMLEVSVSTAVEELKIKRKKAAWFSALIIFVLGLPSALSYSGIKLELFGKPFLDTIDYAMGTLFTPLIAAILCILLGWFWDLDNIFMEINPQHNKRKIHHHILVLLIKYIIPIGMISLFLFEIL